jgi:hypothetical protein
MHDWILQENSTGRRPEFKPDTAPSPSSTQAFFTLREAKGSLATNQGNSIPFPRQSSIFKFSRHCFASGKPPSVLAASAR